jgi:hypothetical protein
MNETRELTKVMTPIFRAAFPHIWKPTESDQGKSVWSVVAIFDADADLKPLAQLAQAALIKKFGDKAQWGKVHKSPFRKGTPDEYDLDKYPEYAGKIICNLKSYNEAPGVVKLADPVPVAIKDQSEFYAGCYAMATVTAFGWDVNGNKGVTFSLQNVCKIKDGVRLGNSRSAPEGDFKELKAADFGIDNSEMLDAAMASMLG